MIAFIGLGIMGSRMAKNLLKHGQELIVYNRSEGPAKELEALGAKRAMSVAEAVKEAATVITMLSTPQVVKALMLEEAGGLKQMKSGSRWIDCSTVNPSFSAQAKAAAQAAGISFLDAPVAGTKPHAANAELVFFVGGEEAEVQEIEPMLLYMGKKVLHIGDAGKGASFKMLVNSLLAQSMLIFSETVVLGEKMGLDKDFLLNTLPNLVVSAPFTKAKAEMIRSNDYEVQFPLELMHKDLQLAALCAYEENQALPMANAAKAIYAQAKQQGLGRLDFAAIHRFMEG
ncbi:MAG: NAD(P)-dependent oxidoreductase [Bacteroidota bacterium]